MRNMTEPAAEFISSVTYEEMPRRGVELAVDAMTDCAGVALAGSAEPIAQKLLCVLGSSGPARAIGTDVRLSWGDAALYNGTVAHAIDYDDTTHPAYAHPSSHILPALLSLGQYRHSTGRDLIGAYIVGLEIESKLGHAYNIEHYGRGWHTTGTFGPIAAAAAGAQLLRLDRAGTAVALGIAASSSSGLRANFGTMTKPLHAGNAARAGVTAALLAAEGFTATEDVFGAAHGFDAVLGQDPARSQTLWQGLGRPWEITAEFGIALKAYPSCGATHPAIEAALDLGRQLDWRDVEAVTVGVNELAPRILVYDRPATPLQGKFSMQYCVGAALVQGTVDRSTFAPGAVADPSVRQVMDKVHVEVDERVAGNPEFGAVVQVRTKDGAALEKLVELARGKPARWLTKQELYRKFQDCTRDVLDPLGTEKTFGALQSLEAASSVDELVELLTGAEREPARPSLSSHGQESGVVR